MPRAREAVVGAAARLAARRSSKGGDNGPAVVPGEPDESLLVQAVRQTHDDIKMPPKGKLPDPAVAAIWRWVEMGAPWPADRPAAEAAQADGGRDALGVPARRGRARRRAVKDPAWVAHAGRRLHPGQARSGGAHALARRPTGGP